MSTVEKKIVRINIIALGKFKAELKRVNAPLTIQKIMNSLPIKGKALKQGGRYVLPSAIKPRPERPKKDFTKGDISIDPSSGNISIFLENTTISTKENYLGRIKDDFSNEKPSLSTGIIIKKYED